MREVDSDTENWQLVADHCPIHVRSKAVSQSLAAAAYAVAAHALGRADLLAQAMGA